MITEILILLISFVLLLAIGVPVAWSIGISGLVTMLVTIDSLPAFTTMAQRMATGLDSFALLAIPFFVLAGQIMNQGGIAERLIAFAKSVIGSLPGGLSYVNVISAMLFGAISGSALAATSAIGGILGPHMEKEGYSKEFGAALNVTSSTTGLIIPPSNILIVYSLASGGVSIAALFIAGYIPGILMGLGLMLVAAIWIRKKKYPPGEKSSIKQVFTSFLKAFPSLFLLVVVIGGIVSGIFTATEASGIAVLYSLILAFVYREMDMKKLYQVFLSSVRTNSIVMLLIATSMAMSWVMSYEDIPQSVSTMLLGLSDNKYVILLTINLILLFVGMFMDMTPAVLIFTPIFLPVVKDLGVDPVHFGIMMIMNLCVGLCTPPVGSVLFVGVGIAQTTIQKVIKPLIPLFIAMFIVLLLVTYIPEITTWLPNLME
ncbi:TRAP transporter large permease [Sinomicrobium weinanense]|uniref:TRAP transporter large permease subunit n=1 Tax=Sinomicrobium weinanense TaxID=2842200 RepID=A0A926JPM7_9FLAO|nr:TRAP transporter large permease subunit [Sinomicrobium weinanense]MBC9795167.1 TRAP transporter large permease subunit [Sinomicrobium weinanense]MBU3121944.1 TRAP transporter large permease subunit [Sinomicrobium weinanense]